MQFHENFFWLIWFHEFYCLDFFKFSGPLCLCWWLFWTFSFFSIWNQKEWQRFYDFLTPDHFYPTKHHEYFWFVLEYILLWGCLLWNLFFWCYLKSEVFSKIHLNHKYNCLFGKIIEWSLSWVNMFKKVLWVFLKITYL